MKYLIFGVRTSPAVDLVPFVPVVAIIIPVAVPTVLVLVIVVVMWFAIKIVEAFVLFGSDFLRYALCCG